MKVNIVIGDSDLGWILGRLARELQIYNGWTINEAGADIDYCIPYLNWRHSTAPLKAGLYTHLEKSGPKRERWMQYYDKFHFTVALSAKTGADYLVNAPENFTPMPPFVIHLGTDLIKRYQFGVVGKVHKSGRKNEALVKKIVDAGYNVMSLGKGWPCEEFSMPHLDNPQVSNRLSFYAHIDYLLITSTIEGGPVPLLDAMACGKPVIAPKDVGWCNDYPCIFYKNEEDLFNILKKLTKPRTWKDVAKETKETFEYIYKEIKC